MIGDRAPIRLTSTEVLGVDAIFDWPIRPRSTVDRPTRPFVRMLELVALGVEVPPAASPPADRGVDVEALRSNWEEVADEVDDNDCLDGVVVVDDRDPELSTV